MIWNSIFQHTIAYKQERERETERIPEGSQPNLELTPPIAFCNWPVSSHFLVSWLLVSNLLVTRQQ